MSYSIYDATIPQIIRMLTNLSIIMEKAESQAPSKGLSLSELIEARLASDMYPFGRQIQMVSNSAKSCAARLAGTEAPHFEDTEGSFVELKLRLAKTIDYLKTVPAESLTGAEDRVITIKLPTHEVKMSGRNFVTTFALPNIYFHVTTAYDLLRHKGIDIGKLDYLGEGVLN